MIDGFANRYPIESDDDGNDIEIWEDATPVQPQPHPSTKHRNGRHTSEWTTPNFRPGTAPEVTVVNGPERRAYVGHGKDLSSPPTTLAETNFALKMAARSSGPTSCYRESPDFFSRTALLKKRSASEKKRVKTPVTPAEARGTNRPSTSESPYKTTTSTTKSPQLSVQRTVVDAALRSCMGYTGRPSPSTTPKDLGTPPTPPNPNRPSSAKKGSNTKQRKAASARVSRQHPVFSPSGDSDSAIFQKRREYPQRPPSRHREPGQSLGLDVHPEPARLRLRSAHYPSHHERPPSRCKPPNQALHLEDKLLDEPEPAEEFVSNNNKGAGWMSSSGTETLAPPAPQAEVEEPAEACPEGTAPAEEVPEADREDIVPSAEDTKRREWSAGLQRPAAPSSKHKPTGAGPHIAQVPFRTSLSPDFLCLFAPASANAPPTPPHPTMQVGLAYNKFSNAGYSSLFSDCFSMGMSDIPSPEDDPFENQHFEDLCISEDESDSD